MVPSLGTRRKSRNNRPDCEAFGRRIDRRSGRCALGPWDACHSKNGVQKPEEVTANLINGVRVHFVPETTYKRGDGTWSGRSAVHVLTDVDIAWIDMATLGVSVASSSGDDGSDVGDNDDEPVIERP